MYLPKYLNAAKSRFLLARVKVRKCIRHQDQKTADAVAQVRAASLPTASARGAVERRDASWYLLCGARSSKTRYLLNWRDDSRSQLFCDRTGCENCGEKCLVVRFWRILMETWWLWGIFSVVWTTWKVLWKFRFSSFHIAWKCLTLIVVYVFVINCTRNFKYLSLCFLRL